METPLLDLSYLHEISGSDSTYMYEVLNLFLETVPKSVETLEQLIRETDDYDSIQRRAHSLKSSSSVIKVRDMFDNVARIDMLARGKSGKDEMITRLDAVLVNFKEALPLIRAERKKNKPARGSKA
jgi:HPt (histidine-containing phosphotransfer) domain-containing protein